MKDKLFIRYFKLKEDTMPFDSQEICHHNSLMAETYIKDYAANIASHMITYPNGKVDFVVL